MSTDEQMSAREDSFQRYPSTTSSSGGDQKPYHSYGNQSYERSTSSRQHSRTSSVAESIDGFTNYAEIVQHLQTVWNNHHGQTDGTRRYSNTHYQKNYSSQSHYNNHSGGQYWNNYNNPRRSAGATGGGAGHYSRGYNNNSNRFPSHRSMNNLMNQNYSNNQQQTSPPNQQQQQQSHEQQSSSSSQSYYKKDRRPNGYAQQQQQHQQQSADPSSISSTQSYPSHLNSYNR